MKLKTSWYFTKWYGLNILLAIQYIPCFKNFAALQIFFHIFFLKWRIKWRKFEPSIFFEAQKYYFVFESRLNFHFFQMVILTTFIDQINVEMGNVDSSLLNVVNFNVEVRNVVSTLIWRCATSRRHINLKATLKQRWNVCWECNLYTLKKTLFQFISQFLSVLFLIVRFSCVILLVVFFNNPF